MDEHSDSWIFFFYDFSLNRAKGQVDQWCIYTNTCTWATHERKGLESPVSMVRESRMEHIQNRVLVFVSFFSSEYFSSTFFSHVPCDYQNLSFGLNPFWNFITWLHSKLSELKKESSRVCETWIHSRPPSPSFSMTRFSLLLDHFTILFLVSVLGPEKHFSKHQRYLKCQLNPELYLGYSK